MEASANPSELARPSCPPAPEPAAHVAGHRAPCHLTTRARPNSAIPEGANVGSNLSSRAETTLWEAGWKPLPTRQS